MVLIKHLIFQSCRGPARARRLSPASARPLVLEMTTENVQVVGEWDRLKTILAIHQPVSLEPVNNDTFQKRKYKVYYSLNQGPGDLFNLLDRFWVSKIKDLEKLGEILTRRNSGHTRILKGPGPPSTSRCRARATLCHRDSRCPPWPPPTPALIIEKRRIVWLRKYVGDVHRWDKTRAMLYILFIEFCPRKGRVFLTDTDKYWKYFVQYR